MLVLSDDRGYSLSKVRYLEQEEKITDQSKREPRKFWSAETTFVNFMHNYSHTRLSGGESQKPLLRFFLRGEGSVHSRATTFALLNRT